MTGDSSAEKLGWTDRPGQSAEMALVFLFTSGMLLAGQVLRYHVAGPGYMPELTTSRLLLSLGMQIVVAFLIGAFLLHRGWPLAQIIGQPAWRDLATGIGIFAIVMAVAAALGLVMTATQGSARVASELRTVVHVSTGAALLGAIINPLFEELLWFGYWFRRLEARGVWLAAVVSLALRTLAHLWKGPVGALTIIPTGVIFTIVYLKTRRLWPIIIAHMAMDAVSLLALSHRG